MQAYFIRYIRVSVGLGTVRIVSGTDNLRLQIVASNAVSDFVKTGIKSLASEVQQA